MTSSLKLLEFGGPTSTKKEALRQLSDTSFYGKIYKDLTYINQNIVKNTLNDYIAKQELPATAKKSHHHHSYNLVLLLFT